jgi:hypothetical protein
MVGAEGEGSGKVASLVHPLCGGGGGGGGGGGAVWHLHLWLDD